MISKLRYILKFVTKHLIDLPKTVYFNFRILPLKKAIKLPIWISHKTKLIGIRKDCITIEGYNTFAMIQFGIFEIGGVANSRKSYIRFGQESTNKLIFRGPARFGGGSYLTIDEGSTVEIGGNFSANNNFQIRSHTAVTIGNDVMIGWNVKIMDSDNHKIYINEIPIENKREVVIGNHVWVGAEVNFLKGSKIPDNSIVGYQSLVTRRFEGDSLVVAGHPAQIIHNQVRWEQ